MVWQLVRSQIKELQILRDESFNPHTTSYQIDVSFIPTTFTLYHFCQVLFYQILETCLNKLKSALHDNRATCFLNLITDIRALDPRNIKYVSAIINKKRVMLNLNKQLKSQMAKIAGYSDQVDKIMVLQMDFFDTEPDTPGDADAPLARPVPGQTDPLVYALHSQESCSKQWLPCKIIGVIKGSEAKDQT